MKNPIVEFLYELIYRGLERFGRYYSVYRAFVVDNADPQNLQKLRIIVPGIQDNPSDKWIPPSNVFYGINWGMQAIPPVGSTIWVEFEKGDPHFPVWRHGYPGLDDIKNTNKRLLDINNFWFQTPQGSIIEMNDTLGTITITDARGQVVQTSKDGISIKPLDKKKIFLGDIDKADQPSVLGDNAVDILNRHSDTLKDLNASVSNMADQFKTSFEAMALGITPIGTAAATLAQAPSVVNTMGTEIDKATTRDNTIAGIKNDTPGIKSGTVSLNK